MRALLVASIFIIGMTSATPPIDKVASLKLVNDGVSSFSANFFKNVAESNSGNVICSALSVDMVLAMLSLGAKGKTLEELQSGLRVSPVKDAASFRVGYSALVDSLNNVENVELKLANKIFDAKTNELKHEFSNDVKDVFKSDVEKVDFSNSPAAANTINHWAAEQTNNKIKELFTPDAFSSDTALVLANAIYFKGQWKTKFLASQTQDLPFHVNESTKKIVPTMYKKGQFTNGYLENMNARWIELPYKGDEFSLLIIMPNEINGLANLQKNIDQLNVTELLNSGRKYELELWLPKFKIESKIDLVPVLKKMGMGEMFSDMANLTGIAETPLKVSEAIQKAYIEVNEEGSEAAAVTEVHLLGGAAPMPPPPKFRVDRPFHYMIYNRAINIPIFEGKVVKPSMYD